MMGTFTVTRQILANIGMILDQPADAALLSWVAAVGDANVSNARKNLVNNLIIGLKADGIWTKLDRLWIHAAENATSALIDLQSLSAATLVGSPPFESDRGYTGQDAFSPSYYIDSNYNPSGSSIFTQNSAHCSTWCVTDVLPSQGGYVLGNNSNVHFRVRDPAGNVGVRINQSAPDTFGSISSGTGHWIENRSGASALQLYRNGASVNSATTASTAVASGNFAILADGSSGGTANQIAMTSFGGSLTGTEMTAFYNRLRTYMTAIGVP